MSHFGIDPTPFQVPTDGDILTRCGFFRVNGYGDVVHYDTVGTFTHPIVIGHVDDDWWQTLTSDNEDEITAAYAEGHSEGYSDGWREAIDAARMAITDL